MEKNNCKFFEFEKRSWVFDKALVTMAHGLTLHNQIMRDELLRTLMLKWDSLIVLIMKIMSNVLLRIARMTLRKLLRTWAPRDCCACSRKRSGSRVQLVWGLKLLVYESLSN